MTHRDLLSACRVLFGARAELERDFVARLDLDSVRRRFRKRAMELHPDRAAVLGRSPAALAEAFKQAEAAHRGLSEHIKAGRRVEPAADSKPWPTRPAPGPGPTPRPGPPRAQPQAGPRPRPPAEPIDHYWKAGLPSRTLRFGEYLYYSGRIPWVQLIRALVWQAGLRPRFGQLAERYGYLTPAAIVQAMSRRWPSERIGEAALRLRLMTDLQQQAVLSAQRQGGRRIGNYFLESGALREIDLENLSRAFRAHNARIALSR